MSNCPNISGETLVKQPKKHAEVGLKCNLSYGRGLYSNNRKAANKAVRIGKNMCVCVFTYIHIYIYIHRTVERERP